MATTLFFGSTLRYSIAIATQFQRQVAVFSSKVTSKESVKSFGDTFGRGKLPDKLIEPSRLRQRQTVKEAETHSRKNRRKQHNVNESDKFQKNANLVPKKQIPSQQSVTTSSRTLAADELKDHSDTFGLLSGNPLPIETDDLETDDEGDRREMKYLNTFPIHWKTSRDYCYKIRKLLDERKLSDALSLFDKMLHEDRVKPESYLYNVLIGGCGRAGYSKMAFKLYNDMKKRQLKPDESTFTGLFNACANSPWAHDGLARAQKLYQEICDKGIIMNKLNYHAAIKAFGRCHDLQMAFRLVDEMVSNGIGVTTETFNFVISACISDAESGFLRAIQVWRKMREKRIRPDIYSYNLLLRSVRSCGIGDTKLASEFLLDEGKPETAASLGETRTNCYHDSSDENNQFFQNSESSVTANSLVPSLPDLLSPKVDPGAVVALRGIKTAQDRLQLLGGVTGLMYRMQRDGANPELKTFTELMQSMPQTLEAEKQLFETMDSRGVRPDVDFFNVLLKRRACRGDLREAKNVLVLIGKHGLHADIATFGTLALTCKNWESAKSLLRDMDDAGFQVNIQVMGTLIHNACHNKDFWYLVDMLKLMKEKNVTPDPKTIAELEDCKLQTKHFIVDKEKQGVRFDQSNEFLKSFRVFLQYYGKWLKEMEIDLPDHPWSSFQIAQSEEARTASDSKV